MRGISGDSILQLSVWLLRSNHDTSEYLGPNLKGTDYLKSNESIDVVVNLVWAVFHTAKAIPQLIDNRRVGRTKRADASLNCRQA